MVGERMKAKSSIKTKADIERHLKRLAGEGSLIALTPKQAKSVKEFVESAEKIGYEQGKKDGIKEESDRHSGVRREWYKRGHDVGYEQGKKEAYTEIRQDCEQKYTTCPLYAKILKRINELSK